MFFSFSHSDQIGSILSSKSVDLFRKDRFMLCRIATRNSSSNSFSLDSLIMDQDASRCSSQNIWRGESPLIFFMDGYLPKVVTASFVNFICCRAICIRPRDSVYSFLFEIVVNSFCLCMALSDIKIVVIRNITSMSESRSNIAKIK